MKTPDKLEQMLSTAGPMACAAVEINEQASIVVKSPDKDLNRWKGERHIEYFPSLGKMEHGAVIALNISIPAKFDADTVLNVESKHDCHLLRKLAGQEMIPFHFFNQENKYTFSKRIEHSPDLRKQLSRFILTAVTYNQTVKHFDYRRARNAYFNETAATFK